MELLKDYDCTIDYHPRKVNVVADALSRKIVEQCIGMVNYNIENLVTLWAINVLVDVKEDYLLATLQVKPSIGDQIKEVQMWDSYLQKMKGKVKSGKNTQFII